jgi:ribose 5-phosphate isomerase B
MARTIAIGCDHVALPLKEAIKNHFSSSFNFLDIGTHTTESCHYPVYAEAVARLVVSGQAEKGILICGTGIGMSIAANKVPGIRAALCHSEYDAEFSRAHNDANVLALGFRTTGEALALYIADRFLNSAFESETEKHVHRVALFSKLEQGEHLS